MSSDIWHLNVCLQSFTYARASSLNFEKQLLRLQLKILENDADTWAATHKSMACVPSNIVSLFEIFHRISDSILTRLEIERLFQAPTVHLAKIHTPIPRCSGKGRHPQKAYASMLEGFIYKQLHFVMSEDKLWILEQLEVTREKTNNHI